MTLEKVHFKLALGFTATWMRKIGRIRDTEQLLGENIPDAILEE